ncbi:Gfo/Idh/MocA family oxidoreductase [Devosia sp. YIM 151766]|uniref:Gfo/Idh/MocA family protein n=1 Tax=Devosia sp. YIM 151766 TaxID=3017325 RepID=UPI00255C8734|nr:Gfo/Idh/MocA family oxidoreductase [Devosia sp. YIM 151766]WIY52003.1 Gfo/Idh/MocA family oxidoreductase [Devosia sp. YIM 151766]
MTAPLKVGLIGLGEVAQLMHLPLLADDKRFSIAAISDVSPSLLNYVAVRYGVGKLHPNANSLLTDPGVDAVFILTPDHLHAELLEAAIRSGKHVFIEKPACLTAGQLAPILAMPRRPGQVVFVGYMRRFSRAFLELKQRLPPLETIRHVRIRDIIREAPFFVAQTRNIFKPNDISPELIAEGRAKTQAMLRSVMGEDCPPDALRAYQVLTGLASHSFSAMRDLLGPPQGVRYAHQHHGETVIALFDYGHFTALYEAVIDDVSRFDAGIEVLTQTQHFKMNYDTPYIRNLPTRLEITTSSATETGTEIIGPIYEDPFRIELNAFLDSVQNGTPNKTSLEDSMADLELFAAVSRHFHQTV